MDRTDIFITVFVLVLTVALSSIIMAVKYNYCMEVKNSHEECVYDVGCNS